MINGMLSVLRKTIVGRDSSVGVETPYGLDGLGIESHWGRGEVFRIRPDWSWVLPSLLYS